jgi:hypothetical protein
MGQSAHVRGAARSMPIQNERQVTRVFPQQKTEIPQGVGAVLSSNCDEHVNSI